MNAFAYLTAATIIVLWGITFASTRVLLGSFSAFEIQVIRFALAYLALKVMSPRKTRTDIPERYFQAMGLTGVFVYQLLENCAISYTNASNVAILVSFAPVLTAVLARLISRDRSLTPVFLIGTALASVGVGLVALGGVVKLRLNPVGDLMAFLAMVSWGVYSILLDRVNAKGCPPILAIRKTFFWALVWMVPLMLVGSTDFGATLLNGSFAFNAALTTENAARFSSLRNLLHLGFLGFFASAFCFAGWNYACRKLGVVKATIGLYFVPVVGVLFAALVLGERLTSISLLGGLIIVFGVFLSNRKPAR